MSQTLTPQAPSQALGSPLSQAPPSGGRGAREGRRSTPPLTNQQKDEARDLAGKLTALSPQMLAQVMRYLHVERVNSMTKSVVCQAFGISPVALATYNPRFRNFSYSLFATPLSHNRSLVNMLAVVSHGQELSREVLVSGDPAAYEAAVCNLNLCTESAQSIQKVCDNLHELAQQMYTNLGRELPNTATAPPTGQAEATQTGSPPIGPNDLVKEQTPDADSKPKK